MKAEHILSVISHQINILEKVGFATISLTIILIHSLAHLPSHSPNHSSLSTRSLTHSCSLLQECYYVLSVSDYAGGEPSLLSFPAHAVIKLTETEHQDHKKGIHIHFIKLPPHQSVTSHLQLSPTVYGCHLQYMAVTYSIWLSPTVCGCFRVIGFTALVLSQQVYTSTCTH